MSRVSAFVSYAALLTALMLPACASRFKISSIPEGAEVRSLSGDVIGKTPIELSDDQSAKLVENGIASFRVVASGHESRLVMADASGLRDLQVSLPKIEGSLFKSDLAQDFSKDLNAVLRDAFVLQKLMLEGKNSDFASRVETFKKNYPQMAFGYLLSAQVALSQGKRTEARASLERAKVLDPADPSIEQNLKLLRGGQP
jgi:hypothetical protein